jgi:tRNA threonylcarbamoyladenosine biosynthesis protein TsaE
MNLFFNLNEINIAAEFIIEKSDFKLILFEGEIGSGKTTLIKKICQSMRVKNTVSSPTFPVLNIYDSDVGNIFHADLYRVENIKDLNELGFFDILNLDNWVFIEWPDKFKKIFDENFTIIKIDKMSENERKLTITNYEF